MPFCFSCLQNSVHVEHLFSLILIDIPLLRLITNQSGFSDRLCLTANLPVPYLLTISLRAGRSLWWGWEPLGGSRTMECHWYSPAHHQSSSSGTKAALPPSLVCIVEDKLKQVVRWLLPQIYFLAPPNLWAKEVLGDDTKMLERTAKKLVTSRIYWKQSWSMPSREKEAPQI